MKLVALIGGGCLLIALGGCATNSPDVRAAEQTAANFRQALDSGDASAACGFLAPSTVLELQKRGGVCEDALRSIGLPPAGDVVSGGVYGLSAQVILRGDTVFLGLTPSGWRVTAAGCTRVPDQPYDCEVKGE